MEANDFITRLKADAVEKYKCDLCRVHTEYKSVLGKLPPKDHGLLGLNVLRTLCWNLDKAPKWRDSIDNATLLTFTIDCIRDTRQMNREDRVKTLACVYHIHKYAVRLHTSIPPELVLKISVMPFELESKYLLKEYYKTYWHILADRFTYIERLKTKVNIGKLLPKLTSDIVKLIDIYDTVEFCSTVIVFLFKKLHMLYSETDASKLIDPFKQIFSTLCQKDGIAALKELQEKDIFDIYTKLNDCLYVVADNSSKVNFKDNILDEIAQRCATLVVHRTDLFYCIQTFYITSFCKIISQSTDLSYVEGIFNSLQIAFQDVNKSNHKALLATYPYLNQLLRLYIEYNITNGNKLTEKIQESCLKLILFFMNKLKDCNQISKCENCPNKTGLHDAFRLSLLNKHLVQNSQNATILDTFLLITSEQYTILDNLKKLGCVNHQKFFRKLQSDVHNTAISLNKSQLYETSVKLFDLYLKYELKCIEIDHKNIARALFNKSICELDAKLYEKALINAFLSLTFARQESLSTDKYMSLVMDIKARELKSKCSDDEEVETDELQLVTVWDACKMAQESKMYGDLMPFFKELNFSSLLRHEFCMYAKLWPSLAPVGGVWRALRELARDPATELSVENEAAVSEVLYDVVLETPSVVRTIHSPHFSTIVQDLLDEFDNMTVLTPDEKLVHATLLVLQCEYNMAAASLQHNWKLTEPSTNPDEIPARRTLAQEHAATRCATRAVQLLRDLSPALEQVSLARLRCSLQVLQALVPQLQHLGQQAPALQLAGACCRAAHLLRDRESFLRNAGVLLTSPPPGPALDAILDRAARWPRAGWGETELAFLCDVAMYYRSQGKPGAAARLVQAARAQLLRLAAAQPDLTLDLAVGRVLEVQNLLFGDCEAGPSALTAANGALRHYIALTVTGTRWSARRVRGAQVRARVSACGARACRAARALGLRARARAAAAAALPAEPAARAASLHACVTDVAVYNQAQVKIDEHLKHILGLDLAENQSTCASDIRKQPLFTPKQDLDPMRDNMIHVRKPTTQFDFVGSVPAFKMPDFFNHDANCTCYACEIPICAVLCCKTSHLEASMYAFANEKEIARNYFEGVTKIIDIVEKKLKMLRKIYMEKYDDFVVESVLNSYDLEFKTVVINSLMDYAFFELKNKEFDAVDELLVRINETIQEMTEVDQYLRTDVLNLMVASAQLKKSSKKPDLDLDEFENLHLSPAKPNVEPPSTPVSKPTKPPALATKIVVKREELPQKRIAVELRSLDLEDDENDFEKPKKLTQGARKDKFKVPNPIIPKPALEETTPRPSRLKPRILVTEPTINMATPKIRPNKENDEYFTPLQPTPEQFFTPMTSIKTYPKRTLRQNIVKNLELELSTPGHNTGKENRRTENFDAKAHTIVKGAKSLVKENSIDNMDKPTSKVEKSIVKVEKSKIKVETSMKKEEKPIVRDKRSNSKADSVKDAPNVPESSRSRNGEKRTLNKAESLGKIENGRDKTSRRRQM